MGGLRGRRAGVEVPRGFRVQQVGEDEAKRDDFPEGTPDVVTTSVLEPTDDVRALTGLEPRSFRDWATENTAAIE